MNDPWINRLSEYLDGELAPAEAVALERHLAECDACRDTLADLSAVVQQAATLPERGPSNDLWPAIEAGIRGRRGVPLTTRKARRTSRRFTFTVPQFAAAAAVLMAVTAGTTWLVSGAGTGAPASPVAAAPTATLRPAATIIAGSSYDNAIRELQGVLAQREGQLDTATVRVIRENLARIDRAIAQARTALTSDPLDPYLTEHLSGTMRRKLELLRRAADLSASAT